MFYASYSDSFREVFAFETEQARDNWVTFSDQFSKAMGTTKENAFFSREAVNNPSLIERIKSSYSKIPDPVKIDDGVCYCLVA